MDGHKTRKMEKQAFNNIYNENNNTYAVTFFRIMFL